MMSVRLAGGNWFWGEPCKTVRIVGSIVMPNVFFALDALCINFYKNGVLIIRAFSRI
jgi:hypothetical protein